MIQAERVIQKVCDALSADARGTAEDILREYPHRPVAPRTRRYTEFQSTRIFFRDGFTDRFFGQKLVFPAALRAVSIVIPNALPFHRNWKMSECHMAYWQLCPTIDHVVPVARGGADDESNMVTTSMLHNSAKANWLLDELGWRLRPASDMTAWDGMVGWFLAYCGKHRDLLSDPYIRRWHKAAVRVTSP